MLFRSMVLEFAGLIRRPLLRHAGTDEQLPAAGTVVRLRLPGEDMTALDPTRSIDPLERDEPPSRLALALGWLAPASEVDLFAERHGHRRHIVRGGDWRTISAERLVARVTGVARLRLRAEQRELIAQQLCAIEQDGEVVGRAALTPADTYAWDRVMGALVVGGLRAAACEGLAGLLLGKDPNVARTQARPVATRATLTNWVEEQARLLGERELPLDDALLVAITVAACGADTGTLPICISEQGPLDGPRLRRWAAERTDRPIYLFDPDEAEDVTRDVADDIAPTNDVLVVTSWTMPPTWWENAEGDQDGQSLKERCLTLLRNAWGGLKTIDDLRGPQRMGSSKFGEVESRNYQAVMAGEVDAI